MDSHRSKHLGPLGVELIGEAPVGDQGKTLYLSDHYGVIAHLRRTGP